MKKILLSMILFLLMSPAFAEDYMFTNEDLILYSNEYMNYKENAHIPENNKEFPSSSEKGDAAQYGTEGSNEQRPEQPKNLSGENCDVLDFSSQKINYAVHNADYRISGTITKQTATVSIKSTLQLPLYVENFYIVAFLEDGTKQTKQLEPAPGDSLTSWIKPDSEYTGFATFDGDLKIVSVGCQVIE